MDWKFKRRFSFLNALFYASAVLLVYFIEPTAGTGLVFASIPLAVTIELVVAKNGWW